MNTRQAQLPQGWEEKALDEVCVLQRGFDLPTHSRNIGRFPLVSSNGITDRIDVWKVKAPGVVTGRSGTIGNIHYIEEDFWPLNTALYIKDFHGNNPRCVYFFLKQFDLGKYSSGAGVPTLNRNNVHVVKVKFPNSLPEQKRIVAILDEAFAAIATAKENAEKNLQNARELFESYLQSVFENKGYDWEHSRLGDICQVNDGTHFSPKNTEDGEYMYITAKNIKPYFIDLTKISYISEKDHKEIYARCSPTKGDVLYIKDGATAGIATINTLDDEFSLLSSVALLKCSSKILNTFLVHYMNSTIGKKNFLGYLDGAAITRLTLIKIKNVCFLLPPLKIQQTIVQKLDALSAETKKLEAIYQQKLNDFEELKKSVLQKAFNGELKT